MPHKVAFDKDGKQLPSVTEIIGILGKPELYRWYAKNGWDKCEQIKRESQEIGTALHNEIAEYLRGHAVVESEMLTAFKNWHSANPLKPLVIEPDVPLQSVYGYQGTFDCIGELDGELLVVDWKTSARIYRESGLQLAAYAQLIKEADPKNIITNGLIVRIDKETKRVQTKMFYNLSMWFDVFKHLLEVYPFVKRTGIWKDA